MRTVVVGASSGLGRCIAVGLAQRGHRVAVLARRRDRLAAAAADAGPHAVAVACDVTDEGSCRAAVAEAAERFEGIDGLVYAAGAGSLARLVDTGAATWHATLATNVVGAALVTAAALPFLTESAGVAAYLSSTSASMTPPWVGLGAYVVSKAALDKLVEAWRVEHPAVGFTRVVVGNCAGGEGDGANDFVSGWDHALAGVVMPEWVAQGYLSDALVDVAEVVDAVADVLGRGAAAAVPSVAVVPPAPR